MQKRIVTQPGREIARAQHRPAGRPLAHYFAKLNRDDASSSVGLVNVITAPTTFEFSVSSNAVATTILRATGFMTSP